MIKRFSPHLNNVSTLLCESWNAHCARATIELLQKENSRIFPPQLRPTFFMPRYLVRHFHAVHFQVLQFYPLLLRPSFSRSAISPPAFSAPSKMSCSDNVSLCLLAKCCKKSISLLWLTSFTSRLVTRWTPVWRQLQVCSGFTFLTLCNLPFVYVFNPHVYVIVPIYCDFYHFSYVRVCCAWLFFLFLMLPLGEINR